MLKRTAAASPAESTPIQDSAAEAGELDPGRRLRCELALAERYYLLKHGDLSARATRWAVCLFIATVAGAAAATLLTEGEPWGASALQHGSIAFVVTGLLLLTVHGLFSEAGRAKWNIRSLRRQLRRHAAETGRAAQSEPAGQSLPSPSVGRTMQSAD